MLYYNIYYFQIISYVFGFVLSQSLQYSQTLGQFFDPLYIYKWDYESCKVRVRESQEDASGSRGWAD